MKNLSVTVIVASLLFSCSATPDPVTVLKADLAYLASDELEGREIGSAGEKLAADYLAKRFGEIGVKPLGTDGYFQDFNVAASLNPHEEAKVGETGDSTIVGRNVVGYIDNSAENTVIIGAHFDHLGYGDVGSLYRGEEKSIHNGADDNASGTSALLQLATRLKGNFTNNNYLFIAFSGEEKGLWGSNYFSKNPTIDLSTATYMINMDMVGRLNRENTLAINGTGTSPAWEEAFAVITPDSLNLVKKESGVGPSDHTSFYLQDLPVLHFFTGQHEDYHRPSDDSELINYEGILTVVEYIYQLVGALDDDGKLAFTKTKDESEIAPRFTVTLGVVPDYLYGEKGMRIDGVTEGKPASNAGIQKGDVVVKMGDIEVTDMMAYMEALSSFEKGQKTMVVILRDGEEMELEVEF